VTARKVAKRLAPKPHSTRAKGYVTGSGSGRVTVTVAGSSLSLKYLASYTPTNGDTVVIDTTTRDWIVLGEFA